VLFRSATMPLPHAKAAGKSWHDNRELLLIIGSSLVSLIGLIIVFSLVASRCGSTVSETTAGSVSSATPSDGPATLAPTRDREHGPRGKAKGKGKH